MYSIGDIVLVSSGQKTKFFEVINVEKEFLWITNGWVQIKKTAKEVELICAAGNRQDKKVPVVNYVK